MKTYTINPACRTDRLAAVSAEFARVGIAFTRIEALDPTLTPARDTEGFFEVAGPLGPVSQADQCRLFSHLRAWIALLESGDSFGAVFEDDVALSDEAGVFLSGCGWIPKDADIVHLEGSDLGEHLLIGRRSFAAHHRVVVPLLSAHPSLRAYVISRSVVQSWLTEHSRYHLPLERHLFDPSLSADCRALSRWQLLPAIAREIDSQVRPRRNLPLALMRAAFFGGARQTVREVALRARGRAKHVRALFA